MVEFGLIERSQEQTRMRLDAFGLENTSKVTGLSTHQLIRWDRNGFFVPSLADPDRRRHHSRIYSYEDVVGLRTIARLLELGVPFSSLKRINEAFIVLNDKVVAERTFYVLGKNVFLSREAAMQTHNGPDQQLSLVALPMSEVVEEVEERVKQLSKRTPDQFGQVTRNRYIMNGQPVLAGTRIPTATITRLIEKGYSKAYLLEQFPRLTPKDIEGALKFETSRRQSAAAN